MSVIAQGELTFVGDTAAERTGITPASAGSLFLALDTKAVYVWDGSAWQAVDGGVAASRTISTTAPLTGGGDLSADRTLAISAATSASAGSMSAADKTKLNLLTLPLATSLTGGGTLALASFTLTVGATASISGANTGDNSANTSSVSNSLLTTRGDLIRRNATVPERLALGSAGAFFRSDGTDALWSTGFLSIIAAKTLTVNKSITLEAAGDGYTLTVPATGTVALLGAANVFTANQRINANVGIAAVPMAPLHVFRNSAGAETEIIRAEISGAYANGADITLYRGGIEMSRLRGEYFTGMTFWTNATPGTGGTSPVERMRIAPTGEVGIGDSTTTTAFCSIKQASLTAGIPVLMLTQSDLDQLFMSFQGGTIYTGKTAADEYLPIKVGANVRYLKLYS